MKTKAYDTVKRDFDSSVPSQATGISPFLMNATASGLATQQLVAPTSLL